MISRLIKVIEEAKRVKGAVLVHVITQKGKGYGPAEKHPARFHGAEPFDIETGIPSHPRTVANYTDCVFHCYVQAGPAGRTGSAITAAMPDGTGLKRFRNMYPDRFFDVGIAEGTCGDLRSRTGSRRHEAYCCGVFFIFTESLRSDPA